MRSFIIFIFLVTPSVLSAQVIDTTALNQLQQGNYSFVEGRVQVVLSDTVSPDVVNRELNKLGLEVSSFNLEPVTAYAEGMVEDSVVTFIKNLEVVKDVLEQQPVITEEDRERVRNNENLSQHQKEQVLEKLEETARTKKLQIFFNYDVNITRAKAALNLVREMKIRYLENLPRSAIVSTEKGAEAEAMALLDNLNFVQYTARIGILNAD